MSWNERWFATCDLVATWSKDSSSKFGCVIVDQRNVVLSLGWNGLPRGLHDNIPSRDERPEKYFWYEHAERNAIYNAASKGISVTGATLYVNGVPCADCARAMIQSGIRVVHMKRKFIATFQASQDAALAMLKEAGVDVQLHDI